jgi:hypothetical protein
VKWRPEGHFDKRNAVDFKLPWDNSRWCGDVYGGEESETVSKDNTLSCTIIWDLGDKFFICYSEFPPSYDAAQYALVDKKHIIDN